MRTLKFPLRVVFYREGEAWVAHCLEMDVIGDGATAQEALGELGKAISMQLEFSLEHKNPHNIFQPADARFFAMFAAGKDRAWGTIALDMNQSSDLQVERMNAREYEEALEETDPVCV